MCVTNVLLTLFYFVSSFRSNFIFYSFRTWWILTCLDLHLHFGVTELRGGEKKKYYIRENSRVSDSGVMVSVTVHVFPTLSSASKSSSRDSLESPWPVQLDEKHLSFLNQGQTSDFIQSVAFLSKTNVLKTFSFPRFCPNSRRRARITYRLIHAFL